MTLNFDFETYTEFTSEFNGGVLLNNSQTVTGLSSRELAYYSSFPQAVGNHSVNGKINYSVASNPTGFAPLMFSNGIGTIQDIFADGPYLGIYVLNSTGTPVVKLSAKSSDGIGVSTTGYALSLSTDIYYTLAKDGASGTLKLYSDAAREILLSTESLTLFSANDTYSHIQVGITSVNAATGGLITGTMSEVVDNLATYDLTVNITGPVSARWSATNAALEEFGPFETGTEALSLGTYTISFNDIDGYPTPSDITGVVVTASGGPTQNVIYTAYTTTEVWVRPLGGSYGLEDGTSYANAFDGFGNINQTILAPDAIINIRGTHKETFIPTRDSLHLHGDISGDDPGTVYGAVTVETAWTVHLGNIYKTEVGTPNVDYFQETEPATPTTGERWLNESTTSVGTLGSVGNIARTWTGDEWRRDSEWFVKPGKVWLDGDGVNMSVYPSTGLKIDTTSGFTSLTEVGLGGQADDYWKGATAVPKFFAWLFQERTISSSTGTTVTFGEPLDLLFGTQRFFYIENIVGECTSHGEWAYLDGFLYMYLDTAPANYTIEYSGLNHGVFSYGHDGIDVDELIITKTNDSPILNWEGDTPTVTKNELRDFSCRGNIPFDSSGVSVHATDPFNYSRATALTGDYSGLTRRDNVTIEDNTIIESTHANGISAYLFTSGSIKRNKIGNIGFSEKYRVHEKGRPSGIVDFGNTGIEIEYNMEAAISYGGILIYSTSDFCRYNVLGSIMNNHGDGGAIYLYGDIANDNEVAYNTINDIRSSDDNEPGQFTTSLYTDAFSYDNSIHDNKTYKLDSPYAIYGIHNNNTTNTPPNVYTDNLFYEDGIMTLFNNEGAAANATQTGTLKLAEATYPTFTLTVNYDGWWSTDGGATQNLPDVPYDYIDGAYLLTFEDIGLGTPNDDVIAVVADTVIVVVDGEIEPAIPVVTIELPTTDPTYETELDSVDLSGSSFIASGLLLPGTVDLVEWDVDTGGSGTCTGTTSWSQLGIPLVSGDNVITITATSDQGKTSTDTLTVTYAPPVVELSITDMVVNTTFSEPTIVSIAPVELTIENLTVNPIFSEPTVTSTAPVEISVESFIINSFFSEPALSSKIPVGLISIDIVAV